MQSGIVGAFRSVPIGAKRVVWTDPVYNFNRHWGYLWDEITFYITYESDWQRAAEIMLQPGEKYTAELQEDAETKLTKMIDRYPLKQTRVDPTLYLAMSEKGIEVTLRFLVDAQVRRPVKGRLYRELLEYFQEDENIKIASTTIEIVGFPPVLVDQRKN